jgi:hypothetical protein
MHWSVPVNDEVPEPISLPSISAASLGLATEAENGRINSFLDSIATLALAVPTDAERPAMCRRKTIQVAAIDCP